MKRFVPALLVSLVPAVSLAAPAAPLVIVDDVPIAPEIQRPQIDIILTRADTRPSYEFELEQAFLVKSIDDADDLVVSPAAGKGDAAVAPHAEE